MKILGYEPSIKLTPAGAPNVQAARDINSYGGNQFGMDMMNNAVGKALNLADKLADEKMTADVMSATTEYQKRLNDALYGEKGLMTRQQAGADGISNEFQEIEKNLRNEISTQYKFTAPRAMKAFDITANREAASRYELIRKHQFIEGEKYKNTALTNNLYEMSNFAGKNYGDDAILADTLANGDNLIAARYGSQGAEVVRASQFKFKSEILTTVFNAAIAADDFEASEKISTKYREFIPSDLLAKTGKLINAYRKENETITEVADLYTQSGGDLDKALELMRANAETSGKGESAVQEMLKMVGIPYELGGDGVSSTDCGESVKRAWNSSGIKFNSRYVPTMIEEAKDKGIWHPPDSGYIPKAGDLAVVDGDEHIVMYDGKGGTIQAGVSKGAVYHSKESPQQMFGKVTGWISAGSKVSPKDMQDKENKLIAYFNKQKGLENMRNTNALKAGEKSLWEAIDKGVNDPKQLESIARTHANGELSVYKSLMQDISFIFDNKKTALSDQTKLKLRNMLETGEINDRTELRNWLLENGSHSDYKEFLDVFDAIEKKEDKYGYDWAGIQQQAFATWGTKDKGIFFYARQATDEFINDYKNKNSGALPSQFLVKQKLIEYGTKPSGGVYNTLWENRGLNVANMRMLGLYDIQQSVINGKVTYKLYRDDGTNTDVTQEQLDSLIEKVKDREKNK